MSFSKSKTQTLARALPFGSKRLSVAVSRAGSLFFVFLSGFILFLSIVKPASISPIQMRVTDLTAPLMQTISTPVERAAETVRTVTGLAELQAENQRLKKENEKLHEWMRAAQILDKENQSLKKLLQFSADDTKHYISTYVISDNSNAYANSVLIKSGAEQGIEKGHAVINNDGLIGRVVATGKNTARILLLNDINARVPVLIQGADVKAIMAGSEKGIPAIKRLENNDIELKDGMTVITSGHGGMLPYGLPVGTLKKISDDSYHVELHADIYNLHFVKVVNKNEQLSSIE